MCVYGEETDLVVWEMVSICQSTNLQWIWHAGKEKEPLATHVLDHSKQRKHFGGVI